MVVPWLPAGGDSRREAAGGRSSTCFAPPRPAPQSCVSWPQLRGHLEALGSLPVPFTRRFLMPSTSARAPTLRQQERGSAVPRGHCTVPGSSRRWLPEVASQPASKRQLPSKQKHSAPSLAGTGTARARLRFTEGHQQGSAAIRHALQPAHGSETPASRPARAHQLRREGRSRALASFPWFRFPAGGGNNLMLVKRRRRKSEHPKDSTTAPTELTGTHASTRLCWATP